MTNLKDADQPLEGYQAPGGYQPISQGYPVAQQDAVNQDPQPLYPGNPSNSVIATAPADTILLRTIQITEPQPNDYLCLAVFVTICCCLPVGIVAIIKSMEVRNRHIAGDEIGAEEASEAAKSWSIISLVLGITSMVSFGIVYGSLLGSALSNSN